MEEVQTFASLTDIPSIALAYAGDAVAEEPAVLVAATTGSEERERWQQQRGAQHFVFERMLKPPIEKGSESFGFCAGHRVSARKA